MAKEHLDPVEQVARAICCPGGCLRDEAGDPQDCWAFSRESQRVKAKAAYLASLRAIRSAARTNTGEITDWAKSTQYHGPITSWEAGVDALIAEVEK